MLLRDEVLITSSPRLFDIAKPQRSHICCVYRYHLLRISSSKTLYSIRLPGLRCCLMVNHKYIQVTSQVLEELYESWDATGKAFFFCGTPATCAERECLIVWKRVLMRMRKMCSAPLPTLMPVSSLCKKCKNGNISTPEICLFGHQRTIGAYKIKWNLKASWNLKIFHL